MGYKAILLTLFILLPIVASKHAKRKSTVAGRQLSSSMAMPSHSYITSPALSPTAIPTPIEDSYQTKIKEMTVLARVSNRFSHTVITSKVQNVMSTSQQAIFTVVLPDTAYITGFTMEVNSKNYTAYIEKKEKAQEIYDQAVASGSGAGLVGTTARDSNRFTVSINVEPSSYATFYLTYEELLQRNDGYEIVINVNPNQLVPNLRVEVVLMESRELAYVKIPPIRSGNEIITDTSGLDSGATSSRKDAKSARVTFSPSVQKQKDLAEALGTPVERGFSGQFVVKYDVVRNSSGGEILMRDGYFVHFFAPANLTPLPKYVVFVLDTSGSMWGRKIEQLILAMKSILKQLKKSDIFSLIQFNTNVKVWNIVDQSRSVLYNSYRNPQPLETIEFPRAFEATSGNILEAVKAVSSFRAGGSTNIYDALRIALRLTELDRSEQPMIIFLTDGLPTTTSTSEIIEMARRKNTRAVPIFSLSFGNGADKNFLRKLSLQNHAFSRHIYEAADAALQLENFYHQISSPLLTDVTFNYTRGVFNLTRTIFPIYFGGGEIVVAGCYEVDVCMTPPRIIGHGVVGPIDFLPVCERPMGELERLWVYLTIKQLLEEKQTTDDQSYYDMKILNLALEYSFVTPLTSLVVVKPQSIYEPSIGYPVGPFGESADISGGSIAGSQTVSSGGSISGSQVGIASSSIPSVNTGTVSGGGIQTGGLASSTTTTNSPIHPVFTAFPWLKQIYNAQTKKISLPSGDYKLLMDSQFTSGSVTCSNPPGSQNNGSCVLLEYCTSVKNLVTSVSAYETHFCPLGSYAGICCPV